MLLGVLEARFFKVGDDWGGKICLVDYRLQAVVDIEERDVYFSGPRVFEEVPVEGTVPEVSKHQARVKRMHPSPQINRIRVPIRQADIRTADPNYIGDRQPRALLTHHEFERSERAPHPQTITHVARTERPNYLLVR